MLDCDRPLPGQALSANMPIQCPKYPFAELHEFLWQELSRALNRALRHDRELPVNERG